MESYQGWDRELLEKRNEVVCELETEQQGKLAVIRDKTRNNKYGRDELARTAAFCSSQGVLREFL